MGKKNIGVHSRLCFLTEGLIPDAVQKLYLFKYRPINNMFTLYQNRGKLMNK